MHTTSTHTTRSETHPMNSSNPLVQICEAGQSVWLDFIQRSLLDGELQRMIKQDALRGLTSNPSIFEQAIANTGEYDESIRKQLAADDSVSNLELFKHLAIDDIQAAADAFADTYRQTDGIDGMVSLEVSPDLAHDVQGTVAMALELHERVNRPNLMVKVPGTQAGVQAFEELTARGLNINVTLLFDVARYREIAQAYIRGLERRHAEGHAVDRIASVASFFVSRVDAAVDKALEAQGSETALALRGRIAIANAKVAYGHFHNLFGSEQFAALAAKGARPQRVLWASTGTKSANYSDVLYVEELIGPDTVNTLPPKTLDAFRDHGKVALTLARGLEQAHADIDSLGDLGISLSDITGELEEAGIRSFAEAFERLLLALKDKRQSLAR